MRCPLTGDEAVFVQSIPVGDLVRAYEGVGRLASCDLGLERYFDGIDAVEVYRSPRSGYEFYAPFDLAGDGALYEALGTIPWYYTAEKWEFTVALGRVGPSDRVLEVGSGHGAFLRRVQTIGATGLGLELNADAAERCRAAGLEVWTRPVEEVADELPGAFDTVVSFQVLEHLTHPLPVLDAACRLLRPGGTLVLGVPNNDSPVFERLDPLNFPPHHMGRWTLRPLLWLAGALPLRVVAVDTEPIPDRYLDTLPAADVPTPSGWRERAVVGARRLLGPGRVKTLAQPWLESALTHVPGPTMVVVYERLG